MAISNRTRVGEAFEALGSGLGPWVDRHMRARSPHKDRWAEEWARVDRVRPDVMNLADPQFALKVIVESWEAVFKDRGLGRNDRNVVFELRDTRNRWAHNEAFSFDDAYRALDSIERILRTIDAVEADQVGTAKADLMRVKYEEEARRASSKVGAQQTLLDSPVAGLKPWRLVRPPHDDVAAGKFELAEFAADLHLVHTGGNRAPLEYRDPVEFFRRTFLTQGLRELLVSAARRISGAGGDPVIDLQTNFGGGKTHSLIALYHFFSSTPLHELGEEVERLLNEADVASVRRDVPRAVIVGTRLEAVGSTKPDGTEVRTMWGELAWQLGGRSAFEIVAKSDALSTNPGVALRELFEHVGPCLILIDEWVAFARLLRSDDSLAAGTFDTHFSFAQSLTEAVGDIPGVLLVLSIPASVSEDDEDGGSENEIGNRDGFAALQQLRNVVGRRGASWRPASADESFEIVSRRLFKAPDGEALRDRDAAVRAFTDLYQRNAAEFLPACRDKAYVDRMKAAYPIHPELFDRLYEDWSTLERFQRTRGVLRLMANVIHALWISNDQAPMIMPGNVPIADTAVSTELTNKLDDNWKPILDADIDGDSSLPAQLDQLANDVGKHAAARRVARTVFLGSAPKVRAGHRGIETPRIRLGCAMPGDKLAVFGDALNRLADRSTYLNVEGNRYWFSVQPTLARLARERSEQYLTDNGHLVENEIVTRLEVEKQPGRRAAFAAVFVAPPSSADVPDELDARLVILGPSTPHNPKGESKARTFALDMLHRRGSSQREYRNTLVFLAADSRRVEELRHAVAERLAWQSIDNDRTVLSLDEGQVRQVTERLKSLDQTVTLRMAETYTQILDPDQPDPTGPIELDVKLLTRPEGFAAAVAKKLENEGRICTTYGPEALRAMVLDGPLKSVWEEGHVTVGALFGHMARYPYLRRLSSMNVLLETARKGASELDWSSRFAVASGFNDGRYTDLTVASFASVTATSLLVRPDVATEQIRKLEEVQARLREAAGRPEPTRPSTSTGGESGGSPTATGPALRTRFYAHVELDPERPVKSFDKIAQEIIAALSAQHGTTLHITVDIEADRPEGFNEATVRTVAENARTLKIDEASFE